MDGDAVPWSIGWDRKSARALQGTKHCLCGFQSWVTPKGPNVRKLLLSNSEEQELVPGRKGGLNHRGPVSHHMGPEYVSSLGWEKNNKCLPPPSSHQSPAVTLAFVGPCSVASGFP